MKGLKLGAAAALTVLMILAMAQAVFAVDAIETTIAPTIAPTVAVSAAPEIPIELNEEFTLFEGQRGNLKSEQVLIEAIDVYPGPDCEDDESCIAVVGSVSLLVSKLHGSVETGAWAQTKVHLTEGESTEVFGLRIKNTGIDDGGESKPDYAEFVITKPVSRDVKAELGEEFKLSTLGTALVQKKGSTVVKMTLNRLVESDRGTYASVTASTTRGDPAEIAELTIKEGGSAAIGNYLVYFNEATSSNYGVFVVKEKETPGAWIVVGLEERFGLLERQTAIVRETGLSIYLSGIGQEKIACITPNTEDGEGNTGSCPAGGYFAALAISVPYEIAESSVASGSGSAGTQVATEAIPVNERTDTIIVEERIDTGTGTGKTVYLREGETIEVFGHAVSLLDLDSGKGTFIVTKKTTPETVRARLNEKFRLKVEQTASILSNGSEVMKLTLNDFVVKCLATNEEGEKRCDGRVIASITASVSGSGNTSTGAELRIYEGEEAPFQGYYIRFADYDNGTGVFVVREGLSDSIIKVRLDQEFGLSERQTALVVEEDLYIRLDDTALLKSNPAQEAAYISVWKGIIVYPNEVETKAFPQYALREGETLSLHGVQITALEIGSGKVEFIVKKKDTSIINVHVNEPFSLEENQTARVLEANMRLDLLNIGGVVSCEEHGAQPGETAETGCTEDRFIEVSVSSYLGESSVGRKVEAEKVTSTVVSSAGESESSAVVNSIEIPEPPKPFDVLVLYEGESAVVNDYEIKALGIGSREAKLVVRKKSSGIQFSYFISTGWNLFSLPGEIEAERNDCASSEWTLLEYDEESNSFKRAGEAKPGKAYWLYNPGKGCEARATIREETTLGELPSLGDGWNFIAVVPEMIGKNINELGNCSLKAAYSFNAPGNNWIGIMNKAITNSDLGKGFVVYSANGTSELPLPPSLPEVN